MEVLLPLMAVAYGGNASVHGGHGAGCGGEADSWGGRRVADARHRRARHARQAWLERYPVRLRRCYAMPGTGRAHGGIDPTRCPVLMCCGWWYRRAP
eukprot:3941214-Rhodomonas_salina.8